jgi:hypothetical protein
MGGMMAIYKVSYVVIESEHPGGIINLDQRPIEGQQIEVGDIVLEIIEAIELMPPRGDFYYYHTTCKLKAST